MAQAGHEKQPQDPAGRGEPMLNDRSEIGTLKSKWRANFNEWTRERIFF